MSANTQTFNERVLDYIQLTGAVMEKAAASVQEKEAQAKKVEDLIPKAIEALLENERIEPHQKEAAAKLLRNPATVLEILIKTAAHRNDKERTELGQPVEKKASKNKYDSLADGYVGRRSSPGERASDLAFKARLGVG